MLSSSSLVSQNIGTALLRVVAGLLFMQHGAQKLFGWFGGMGGTPGARAELMSLMGLAGVLELFGGLLIVLGLLTRPVALLLTLQMLAAYLMAHAGQGAWPIMNQGELALLYAAVFLFLFAHGPGRYSLDARIRGGASETGERGATDRGARRRAA